MTLPTPKTSGDDCSSVELSYLKSILVKAITYAGTDPETSLMYARKSAEGICTDLFSREIGDPKNNRLDKLIELLSNKATLPERIRIPFRVIQQYGNYGAHVQPDREPISQEYIEPCLTALVHVTNWYFSEYLSTTIPSEIVSANNEYEPFTQQKKERTQDLDQEDITQVVGLPFPLRKYQWEGVRFLLQNDSALLADEMGLGKTVQAIVALSLIFKRRASHRALIVVPASLVLNWEKEFSVWAPHLTVRRLLGTHDDRRATYQLPIQVLIGTYEQVRNDAIDMALDVTFDLVILDEAQRIKNRDSLSALGVRLLKRRRSWTLTGTPLENTLDDILSLFLFLKPGLVDIGMPPTEIQRRIQPYFFRRRKSEVLGEMPPIIIQDLPLELSGEQEAAYTELWISRRREARKEGSPATGSTLLALLTRLKQLCNFDPISEHSVKCEALLSILEDLSNPSEKVIIFSQYVETLNFISKHLGTLPHNLFTGSHSQSERQAILDTFKTKPGPRALLMSLHAGGVGLNLQEASTVILFDRWWNPAVENQAIHRAHRFGRTQPLHVIRFVVSDTIEERIAEILENKQKSFDRYVEGTENAPVHLFTRDEIRRILELSIFDADEEQE